MKKILIIEDNLEVRENTAEILELSGYTVATAEDGKVGVKLAQTEQPDLIICDIMMPNLDGYGVLRILNKDARTAKIPFVFLTAKAEMLDLRKGMNLGADDYLTKPFDEVELMDIIEMRLEKSAISGEDFEPSLLGLSQFFSEAKSRDALAGLSEDREMRVYKAKDNIFSEGTYPHGAIFVSKGKIKGFKTNPDGKDYITNLYKPGDFIGYAPLLTDGPYHESAVALEETEVAFIPKEDFFALVYNNRDVSNTFIRMLAGSLEEKENQLLHLAYDTVRKRVADALLTLKSRYKEEQGDVGFSINIPRDTLAAMVGTSKECVIRVLSDFKEEKMVATRMSEVTILDEKKLTEVKW